MTTQLRINFLKVDALPKKVEKLDFPLLETSTQRNSFTVLLSKTTLDELDDPSTIFSEGASLDLAMSETFINTRKLVDGRLRSH